MAQRIIATFSGRDAMLPFFNAIAGETVFVEDRGEDVLILASSKPEVPAELADFRTFLKARGSWPARVGDHYEDVFATLADAMADYADEIRKRSGC